MSDNSNAFVDRLKASLGFMSQDSVAYYKEKLTNWKLTRKQWESALDEIVNANTEGRLPPLAVVFAELERQQEAAKVKSALGWASFRWKGHDYSIRIKHDGQQWVIGDLVNSQGNPVQAHVGESVVEYIPVDATDFLISPDDPPKPEPEELPSRLEVKEFMAEINANLSKLKEVPF